MKHLQTRHPLATFWGNGHPSTNPSSSYFPGSGVSVSTETHLLRHWSSEWNTTSFGNDTLMEFLFVVIHPSFRSMEGWTDCHSVVTVHEWAFCSAIAVCRMPPTCMSLAVQLRPDLYLLQLTRIFGSRLDRRSPIKWKKRQFKFLVVTIPCPNQSHEIKK